MSKKHPGSVIAPATLQIIGNCVTKSDSYAANERFKLFCALVLPKSYVADWFSSPTTWNLSKPRVKQGRTAAVSFEYESHEEEACGRALEM